MKRFLDYTVFDLECTGFKKEDVILSLSAVKVRGGNIVSEFNTLINVNVTIPPQITELTGISNEMITDDLPTLDIANKQLTDFIGDDVIVGQNVLKFDLPYIKERTGFVPKNEVVDTYDLLKFYNPFETENLRLESFHSLFGMDGNAHESITDCRVTHVLYQRLLDVYDTMGEGFGELLEQRVVKLNKVAQSTSNRLYFKSGEVVLMSVYQSNNKAGVSPYRLQVINRPSLDMNTDDVSYDEVVETRSEQYKKIFKAKGGRLC